MAADARMRGDYNPFDPCFEANGSPDDDLCDVESRMHWTDAFPHGFHGWGPLTPDHDRSGQDRKNRFRTRLKPDDHYLTWRAEEPFRAQSKDWRDDRLSRFEATSRH
jgi:hypothetical protein